MRVKERKFEVTRVNGTRGRFSLKSERMVQLAERFSALVSVDDERNEKFADLIICWNSAWNSIVYTDHKKTPGYARIPTPDMFESDICTFNPSPARLLHPWYIPCQRIHPEDELCIQ